MEPGSGSGYFMAWGYNSKFYYEAIKYIDIFAVIVRRSMNMGKLSRKEKGYFLEDVVADFFKI
ncbi:MAG: hypothetical protein ACTSYM_14030 [Candidatus Baldrarchaeia archaeon]